LCARLSARPAAAFAVAACNFGAAYHDVEGFIAAGRKTLGRDRRCGLDRDYEYAKQQKER